MQKNGRSLLVLSLYPDDHLSRVRKFYGIPPKVDDNLPQSKRVTHQSCGYVLFNVTGQLQSLIVCLYCQHISSSLQCGTQVKCDLLQLDMAGLDLGKIQDTVQEGKKGIRRGLHCLQVFPLFFG